MKLKYAGMWEASNVSFDSETCRALSYNWWVFVDKFGKDVIFNAYQYSPTTIKHQYKVKALLKELGIRIKATVHCPGGLQDLDSGIRLCNLRIDELSAAIKKHANRKGSLAKNIERAIELKRWTEERSILEVLKKRREKDHA